MEVTLRKGLKDTAKRMKSNTQKLFIKKGEGVR